MTLTLTIETPGLSLVNITHEAESLLEHMQHKNGVAHLFIQHTSASLVIQENADPDVQRDLISYFDRIAPDNGPYLHTAEGPDDMPAHIKSALTSSSLSIPFANGRFLLGSWQGIYLFEHRRKPQRRRIVVTIISAE
jgi:secondary thiamine-phosphate synthase enzyme